MVSFRVFKFMGMEYLSKKGKKEKERERVKREKWREMEEERLGGKERVVITLP